MYTNEFQKQQHEGIAGKLFEPIISAWAMLYDVYAAQPLYASSFCPSFPITIFLIFDPTLCVHKRL